MFQASAHDPTSHGGSPPSRAALSGHLLLVEDDADIAETMREFVEEEGYAVTWAADGITALEHLREGNRPALVVTDFMMPGLSGAELAGEIGKDGNLRDIPVLVVSAVPQLAAAAGVPTNALVTKPVDLLELMRLVSRRCRRVRPAT